MRTYYFVFWLIGDDGFPMAEFTPNSDGNKCGAVHLTGGAPEFLAAIMQAMLDEVALTVGQMEFEWGTAMVHLPQVWDDTPSELVQMVLASAEGMFLELIQEHPPEYPPSMDNLPFPPNFPPPANPSDN